MRGGVGASVTGAKRGKRGDHKPTHLEGQREPSTKSGRLASLHNSGNSRAYVLQHERSIRHEPALVSDPGHEFTRGVGASSSAPTDSSTTGSTLRHQHKHHSRSAKWINLDNIQKRDSMRSNLWVDTPHADCCFALAILMHSVVVGVSVEMGLRGTLTTGEGQEETFAVMMAVQGFLCGVFSVEFLLRIQAHKTAYVWSFWGLFDGFLVLIGWADVINSLSDVNSDLGALGAMRMCRLLRLMRVVRVLNIFPDLRVLVSGLVSTFATSIWAVVLLLFFAYVGALICADFLGAEPDKEVHELFGSVLASIITHVQLALVEAWPDVAEPMLKHSGWWAVYVAIFILVTNVALLNVVTGVICEQVMALARRENQKTPEQFRDMMACHVKNLETLFQKADTNKDEQIDEDEYLQMLESKSMRFVLKNMGVGCPLEKEHALTVMIEHDNGKLNKHAFVDGIKRFRGTSVDHLSQCLQYDVAVGVKRVLARVAQAKDALFTTIDTCFLDAETRLASLMDAMCSAAALDVRSLGVAGGQDGVAGVAFKRHVGDHYNFVGSVEGADVPSNVGDNLFFDPPSGRGGGATAESEPAALSGISSGAFGLAVNSSQQSSPELESACVQLSRVACELQGTMARIKMRRRHRIDETVVAGPLDHDGESRSLSPSLVGEAPPAPDHALTKTASERDAGRSAVVQPDPWQQVCASANTASGAEASERLDAAQAAWSDAERIGATRLMSHIASEVPAGVKSVSLTQTGVLAAPNTYMDPDIEDIPTYSLHVCVLAVHGLEPGVKPYVLVRVGDQERRTAAASVGRSIDKEPGAGSATAKAAASWTGDDVFSFAVCKEGAETSGQVEFDVRGAGSSTDAAANQCLGVVRTSLWSSTDTRGSNRVRSPLPAHWQVFRKRIGCEGSCIFLEYSLCFTSCSQPLPAPELVEPERPAVALNPPAPAPSRTPRHCLEILFKRSESTDLGRAMPGSRSEIIPEGSPSKRKHDASSRPSVLQVLERLASPSSKSAAEGERERSGSVLQVLERLAKTGTRTQRIAESERISVPTSTPLL